MLRRRQGLNLLADISCSMDSHLVSTAVWLGIKNWGVPLLIQISLPVCVWHFGSFQITFQEFLFLPGLCIGYF